MVHPREDSDDELPPPMPARHSMNSTKRWRSTETPDIASATGKGKHTSSKRDRITGSVLASDDCAHPYSSAITTDRRTSSLTTKERDKKAESHHAGGHRHHSIPKRRSKKDLSNINSETRTRECNQHDAPVTAHKQGSATRELETDFAEEVSMTKPSLSKDDALLKEKNRAQSHHTNAHRHHGTWKRPKEVASKEAPEITNKQELDNDFAEEVPQGKHSVFKHDDLMMEKRRAVINDSHVECFAQEIPLTKYKPSENRAKIPLKKSDISPPSSPHRSPNYAKKQRRNTATSNTNRNDESRGKSAGPALLGSRDIDGDEPEILEGRTGQTPEDDGAPGRTGAYFITGTGSVVSRHRGSLTQHPDNGESLDVEGARSLRQAASSLSCTNGDNTVDGKETLWYCTMKFKIIAVLLVIAAIAIGVAVPLATGGSSGDGDDAPLNPRMTAVRAILIARGASALDDEGSPQNLAVNWLVFVDTLSPIEDTVDDESIAKLIRRYALVVFYYGTGGGESWFMDDNWLDGQVEECDWKHITCEDGVIVSIDTGINGNNVVGSIPTEISELTSLRELVLRKNQISGIPFEMELLTNMTVLDLELNTLEGSIPSSVYKLTNLETLHLNQNKLNGTISPFISALTNLKELWFQLNSLTGTLTNEFQSLASLTHLGLNMNMLNGNIDEVLFGLSNLELLRLDSNRFGGTLPSQIGTFAQLQDLNVGLNELISSTIPSEVGKLTNLLILSLFRTEISGTIPSELGNLFNLTALFLENTFLTGSIPAELCEIFEQKNDTLQLSLDCIIQCNCTVCDEICV